MGTRRVAGADDSSAVAILTEIVEPPAFGVGQLELPYGEAASGARGRVYVESYPIYGDKGSIVPTSIEYITSGSVQEECVIQNNATASGSRCQYGLWW